MPAKPLKLDTKAIERNAMENLERGPVTADYDLDAGQVIEMLQDVLATELVCQLRYQEHYHLAANVGAELVAEEFAEHAEQERQHAHRVANRIGQLGGSPDFDPGRAAQRSHAPYRSGNTVTDMIREDLIAERIACNTYREIVKFLGDRDPTTRRLMESILEQEEEHADDMASLLQRGETRQEAQKRQELPSRPAPV